MITNPVTQAYLESAMTVQSLFGQAGGAHDVVMDDTGDTGDMMVWMVWMPRMARL